MRCEECRAALSAQLDGERHEAAPDDVDTHLTGCAACRRWYDDAAAVTRLARTTPADDEVDVAAAVLPSAPAPARVPVGLILRAALAVVAMAQLVIGFLLLAGVEIAADHIHVGSAAGDHSGSESAAWDIAIGAGFLWIAARRGRPSGALPILTVFVAALVALNAGDLLGGRTDLAHVATHSFVVVGYAIVLALLHPATAHRPPSGSGDGSGSGDHATDAGGARIIPIRPAQRPVTEAHKAA